MDNSTLDPLRQALNYGAANITAIGNNLANINTPGYKRKEAFSSALDAAQDDIDQIAMRKTNALQMGDDDPATTPVQFTTNASGATRLDGNNVDIDSETAKLAAAQIFYQGASQLTQNEFSGLKYAISGGS